MTLTFIWPWPTRSYFSILLCLFSLMDQFNSYILGQNNIYDLTCLMICHDIDLLYDQEGKIFSFALIAIFFLWMDLTRTWKNNTYDIINMFDDFNMTLTFVWPWPTSGFPFLINKSWAMQLPCGGPCFLWKLNIHKNFLYSLLARNFIYWTCKPHWNHHKFKMVENNHRLSVWDKVPLPGPRSIPGTLLRPL